MGLLSDKAHSVAHYCPSIVRKIMDGLLMHDILHIIDSAHIISALLRRDAGAGGFPAQNSAAADGCCRLQDNQQMYSTCTITLDIPRRWRGCRTASSWKQVWGGNATVWRGICDRDQWLRYREQTRPGTATAPIYHDSRTLLTYFFSFLGPMGRRQAWKPITHIFGWSLNLGMVFQATDSTSRLDDQWIYQGKVEMNYPGTCQKNSRT